MTNSLLPDFIAAPVRHRAKIGCGVLVLALAFSASAQQLDAVQPSSPSTAIQKTSQSSSSKAEPALQTTTVPSGQSSPSQVAATAEPMLSAVAEEAKTNGISEEELRRMLVGKALYLRGGYLDNTLTFDEHGHLIGNSPRGSYTLSAIQVNKLRLAKHKVQLEGVRFGLHFVGQLAYEDSSKAVDRVEITPRKKVVKITIDREMVVNPKKKKDKEAVKKTNPSNAAKPAIPAAASTASSATPASEPAEPSEADQLKASIAAAPETERPADPANMTTTISPAHAAKVLKDALDQIFAQGLDDRMMASMPDFWKLYYQAVAAKTDYRPQDPTVLRQNTVDQKARLLTTFEPDSNEFAQAHGVAGMALYHTVIGADGKAGEIAVGRPIGFGLDENAVAAIRKASFQPAIKDGKPVAVLLNLVVQFRIFSKRTSAASQPEATNKPAEPMQPGPYSLYSDVK